MSHFDIAVQKVLEHEGHFSNDPDDPGGATNYGISLRFLLQSEEGMPAHIFETLDVDHDGTITAEDIQKMTVEQAKEIYKTLFWDKNDYNKINPQWIAVKVFDLCVNMGAPQAHKCLQRAVRAASSIVLEDDGVLGPKTIAAVNGVNLNMLLSALKSEAAGFYRSLNRPKYLAGWLNRAYS